MAQGSGEFKGLKDSNDCCINLWMRKNKLFVHYMYTSF